MQIAGEIRPVDIREEMERSYLDYAMSVIVGRAIPDVRDGLKPVQRRILYSMYEQGNTHQKPFKKSARIVGDVIGKYHPHGDQAVYDALVRMAQDFTMRLPLVEGQGNFGSVDGDSPAAMRYTEVRLSAPGEELLRDIEKETVEWGPNYDDSLKEPLVLPSRLPNLLLNGASGIAVGMATSIPPHNLRELCDALLYLMDHPQASEGEIRKILPGPDFPTGGVIYGWEGIEKAYATGQGSIKIRGKVMFENLKRDRTALVITEIPYQVNKAGLIERIAELVKEKRIEGISDIRDESDREGIRVVLELKPGAPGKVILNQLYQMTPLQTVFHVQLLAIDKGKPVLFTLKGLLQAFLDFREVIVLRRTRFDLKEAEKRAHILQGLSRALDHLDEIIATIRKSPEPATARTSLMEKFHFTFEQAQAILDMRLSRLTALEREKIVQELKEVQEEVRRLSAILNDRNLLLQEIRRELIEIKEKYGDTRKTEIVPDEGEIAITDLIADEEVVVLLTYQGYVKRVDLKEFRRQQRGGRGKIGMGTREEDWVYRLFVAHTHDLLLCFTNQGKVHALKVYEVPEAGRMAKGMAIVNLLRLREGERVTALIPVRSFAVPHYLFFATKKGVVKKTPLSEYENIRSGGIQAIALGEGDEVVEVLETKGNDQIVLITQQGFSIRFSEEEVRPTGRATQGVRGIHLAEGDKVVSALVVQENSRILTVTEKGFSKKTPVEEYRIQSRGGKGVRTMRLSEKTGYIVDALSVSGEEEIVVVTSRGQVLRLEVEEVSDRGRATQGVRVMRLEEGEVLQGVARALGDGGEEEGS